MQAHDTTNREPLLVRPKRCLSSDLCPSIVHLNDVQDEVSREGNGSSRPLCKVNHDERVHFFTKDDDESSSDDESSIDERELFELWRHDDSTWDDSRDDDDYDEQGDDSSITVDDVLLEEKGSFDVGATSEEPGVMGQKRVTFGTVAVREYGLTVGAYSASRDSCPLQLSWEYSAPIIYNVEHDCYFKGHGRLRRLSVEQRRKRIARVQGIPVQRVILQEYESTLSSIRDSIQGFSRNASSLLDHRWNEMGAQRKLQSDTLFAKSLLREMPPLPLA